MMTTTIYNTALVVHIAGLTMMAGTTLVDSLIYRQLWKQYRRDVNRALGTIEATSKLAVLFGLGFLLLLVSGITLMAITHGLYGEQLWFRVKMILVLAVLINGLAIGRRTGLKVRKTLALNAADSRVLAILHKRLVAFHISQLILFMAIFVMGVFKFN